MASGSDVAWAWLEASGSAAALEFLRGAVAWANVVSASGAVEVEVSAKDADDGATAAATGSAGRTSLLPSTRTRQHRPN